MKEAPKQTSASASTAADLIQAVIQSSNAQILNNLGNDLSDLACHEWALTAYDKAIAAYPHYSLAHFNRGCLLQSLGEFALAIEAYRCALQSAPLNHSAYIHNNLAIALTALKRYEEAIQSYTIIAESSESDSLSQSDKELVVFDLAKTNLRLGRYEAGWQGYEARRFAQRINPRVIHIPELSAVTEWSGAESLTGKKILIWTEQGFGDTFQFCRYLALLVAQNAHVIFEASHPSTLDLLQCIPDVEVIADYQNQQTSFDFHCPLVSLPLKLKTFSEQRIPNAIPYIVPPQVATEKWRALLAKNNHPPSVRRIGFVWKGHIQQSLELNDLAPFFDLNSTFNLQFFSLQKGAESSIFTAWQAAHAKAPQFFDYTSHLDQWADTASLIAQLDLVISVDTAIAHLAGAMGKPVWILLPYHACWRWLHERNDSPWYPTMRLFRQPSPSDWSSVIEEIKTAFQTTLTENQPIKTDAPPHPSHFMR